MAVNVNKPESQAQAAAAAPQTIELVLASAKRLFLGEKLYVAGVRYVFSLETGLDLLDRTDSNGNREWKRPDKVMRVTEEAVAERLNGPREVVTAKVPDAVVAEDLGDDSAVQDAAKKGIEIMDDGEAV
ncbi:hypothetical protein WK13_34845 [Burkholderia ubonensis]|uniref:hypothetical protein n=1 Tax=Burkholderia ubonensis TaxID=101571 RepID=UPI00075D936B|nr:hypothetical protein [Burkholderia ubonensis]KVR21719.1 hypothetical protein WK13_34845 [Burkholderia ubonensis]